MTARQQFIEYCLQQLGESERSLHTCIWDVCTDAQYQAPQMQELRQHLIDWWGTLSAHEKTQITDIPLPLVDDTCTDWSQTLPCTS